jgi:hypothetical protein
VEVRQLSASMIDAGIRRRAATAKARNNIPLRQPTQAFVLTTH